MSLWSKIPLGIKIVIPSVAVIFAIVALKPQPEVGKPAEAPATLAQVNIVYANPKTSIMNVQSQGTVEPRREIDLVSQVSGRVVEVSANFVTGGVFSQAQTLIKIEDTDYRTALTRAQASLARAEMVLAQEKGLARQAKREWRDLGNAEANSLFLREPQINSAQADVLAAQADVENAKLDLVRTQISVPFAGRIRDVMVDLGQYVSLGTKLARVYDTSLAQIRLSLTDNDIALLDLPTVNSTLQANPAVVLKGQIGRETHTWQGEIVRTEASLDTRSRMYYAVAEVNEPYQQAARPLMVGMFVQAELQGKELNNVVKLPRDAVFKQDQLYLINAQQTIELEQVEVLSKNREFVWVRDDKLVGGTPVVVSDQVYLNPGLSVDLAALHQVQIMSH